ncbi:MAG: ABC transporter permease [Muribaculaceae bacterium]|nr:ABC transporter permease [Muribaculaceae bacterium]
MKTSILDIENWREIVATLSRNKTRTFLTAFGIFWGTAMLAMLWGGVHGFEGIMRRNFAGFATNTGAVFSGVRGMNYKGFNKGSWWTLTEQDVADIRRLAPYMQYSSEVNRKYVSASYNDKSKSANALGVDADFSRIQVPVIYEGRFINDTDVRSSAKVTVIGKNLSNELFGGESPIGRYVSLNGIYFKVVGVAGQKGEASIMSRVDDSFVLPSATMRVAFNRGTMVEGLIYTAPDGHKPSDNEKAIRRIISAAHYIHPDDERAVNFMDVSEMFEMIDTMFLGLSILALFIGASSLMAGVIGVGNIMWIIVKERTHEFGIRRAIGAKPADITVQVLSESVLLTIVAGIAGVCFASLVLGLVDKGTMSPTLGAAGFQLPFSTAATIVAVFFVLGSLAGTLPAVEAMRIRPIEAIRDK